MSTGAVQSTTTTTPKVISQKDVGMMGKDDFLKLLLAQLKNQDPLKPMDDTQFISQLAQFSTLEKITEMNQNMALMLEVDQLGQATSLVGKMVESKNSTTGEVVKGVVDSARMEDRNAVVMVGGKSVPLTEITTVTEEGGARLLRATSLIGKEVEVRAPVSGEIVKGPVSSVRVTDGTTTLVLGDKSAPLANLVSVLDPVGTQVTQASNLVGMQVEAIVSASGAKATAVVDRVRTVDGVVQLSVGSNWVTLDKVTGVAKDPSAP